MSKCYITFNDELRTTSKLSEILQFGTGTAHKTLARRKNARSNRLIIASVSFSFSVSDK
jgi:hypothetical protein